MPPLSLAVPDWEERIVRGQSLMPAIPLDEAEAERAVRIFNKLRLPDVPGKPFLADACGDWFREIVRALFGSIDRQSGARLVREVFLLAAKKSAKTSLGAGLMLTALLMNSRPRAEFLLIAPTQAIADLAFSQVIGMVEADEDDFLKKRLHVQEHLKRITDRSTKAQLRVKTFDTSVLTGVKPAGVLVDELHEISRSSDAARVIGQIRGGMLPNPEAFLAFITTQSDRPPAGAFKAELTHARAVRDGIASGPLLPVLYEFPEAMITDGRWRDPANWWMVSPNRGRSMTVERLIPDWEAAQLAGEEEIRRWGSQHLNLEIGLALRSDRWGGADWWLRRADPTLTLESLIERSDVAVVGVDGGGQDDLLGLVVLGREKGTRRWLLWARAWAHLIVLERRKDIAARLLDFQREGTLTIIPDESDADVKGVADIVEQVEEAGLLPRNQAIGVDPVGITEIVDELELRGFSRADDKGNGSIIGIKQGWTLSNAIKSLERRLAAGNVVHDGSAMMAWVIGNVKIEPRGNAIIATKQAAGNAKIDPFMAALNTVSLMTLNPSARRSIFDDDEAYAKAFPQQAAQQAVEPASVGDDDHAAAALVAWQKREARFNAMVDDDEEG